MFRKSLELDPQSASGHYNVAGSLARDGEYEAAEAHFRAALNEKPDAQAYTGLGYVLGQQGRLDEAITSLREAIETDPEHPAAYDQLGTILAEQGKFEEAASDYRHLLRIQPSPAAHRKLAQVLMRLGRTEEAKKEMAKALDPIAE